jgi:hypothetical protein
MKQKIKKKQNSMWFGEPHLFLERGSPTGLNASGQQSYEQ